MYKLSIYNYVVKCDNGELRLYNSLNGIHSLLMIPIHKVDKINQILNDINNPIWHIDPDFNVLKSLGYIIEEKRDEIVQARCKLNDVINQSDLLLTIMPTEDCNFRCKYCYEDHKKGKMSQSVQDSIIKYVRKNLNKYTKLRVAWFGGEPLEALDVISYLSENFIHICNVSRKNYSSSMTTNGYNLNIDTFKKLISLKIYDYQITLDGLKNTHDKYRVLCDNAGTFDTIVSNLKKIKDFRRNTFEIAIRTNFTKESYDNLTEYLSFCEELFGDDSRFSLFVHMVGNWGGDIVNNIEADIIKKNHYSQLIKDILKTNPKISFKAHLNDLDPLGSKCYASLRNSYVVGSDGALYKCTEDFRLKENCIGYLDNNGDMILNNDHLALWLDWSNNSVTNSCVTCTYLGCCLGGPCPKVKIGNKHKITKSFCPRTKSSVVDILKLIDRDVFILL